MAGKHGHPQATPTSISANIPSIMSETPQNFQPEIWEHAMSKHLELPSSTNQNEVRKSFRDEAMEKAWVRVTRTTDRSCRPQSPMEKQTDSVTAEAGWRLKSHAGTRARAKWTDIPNQPRLIYRLMTMILYGQTWGTKCHPLSRRAHRPRRPP